MDIQNYISEIRTLYASGQTTEHSFRPALAKLFGSIDPALTVINEPKHITDVGAPDFVFMVGEVPIGRCESKNCLQNGLNVGKEVDDREEAPYTRTIKEHLARLTSR